MASKRSDAQTNRAHLLTVARSMMRKSTAAPAFNELAKKASVGVGTVYRHFADHQALLVALVEAQLVEFEALISRVKEEQDPWSALETLFRGALELELRSPVVAQLLAAPKGESKAIARQLAALEVTAELIVARARKANAIRADIKAGDLRRLVCGLELAVRAGDAPDEAAERYVEIVLEGIKARSTAR